ncbi:MAG TPA: DUF2147 domain-containing protein [Spirochaetota bacterium]|nr:DUF2147 domain-containing protein [Spirochaetota bacterium]HOD13557.1 DUF2147 domain-containing protein [Spirochaetota bacterium]HPG50520.1 DUF2147 domain-containing protein [Spirochaetota bacterium]HPN11813.1 DUF2147 domain-containing protein [Spirochaetota bacterium]HQL81064.1 DUF2147 domain-containing protein [Spirochaetota bacterium]
MKPAIPLSICLALVVILAAFPARAELDIVGTWKNVDARTGRAKSHIKIWEKDGIYYGKIEYLLDPSTGSRCDDCAGTRKGRPIVGMVMLWGMKKAAAKDDGLDFYSGGRFLDVGSGNDYSCRIWRMSDNKIRVRRYVFLFYRTEYWYRIK